MSPPQRAQRRQVLGLFARWPLAHMSLTHLPLGLCGSAWGVAAQAQAPTQASAPTPFTLSVVPQFNASLTTQHWLPLLEALKREGIDLQLRVSG